MKLFIVALSAFFVAAACGAEVAAGHGRITQVDVKLDLSSGTIHYNGETVDLAAFSERVKDAYSISLTAMPWAEHGVEDLFSQEDGKAAGKNAQPLPLKRLVDVLGAIDAAGIEPGLVRLEMSYLPRKRRPVTDDIRINGGGGIELNGSPVALSEFSSKLLRVPFVTIGAQASPGTASSVPMDYRSLLAVLRSLGADVQVAALSCHGVEQVKIEAMVFHPNPDGTRDVLTAPQVTTRPGGGAMIRVVENESGRRSYFSGTDGFHQEDLANLGVRFSANPQLIGDNIRVSGVVIVTKGKAKDKKEVFRDGDIPIYSYLVTKMVAPYSVLLPPGTKSVEFPIADVGGKPTMCRLKAQVVDQYGMTAEQRAKAPVRTKGAAPPHKR